VEVLEADLGYFNGTPSSSMTWEMVLAAQQPLFWTCLRFVDFLAVEKLTGSAGRLPEIIISIYELVASAHHFNLN
jgi:hypothetical protein